MLSGGTEATPSTPQPLDHTHTLSWNEPEGGGRQVSLNQPEVGDVV